METRFTSLYNARISKGFTIEEVQNKFENIFRVSISKEEIEKCEDTVDHIYGSPIYETSKKLCDIYNCKITFLLQHLHYENFQLKSMREKSGLTPKITIEILKKFYDILVTNDELDKYEEYVIPIPKKISFALRRIYKNPIYGFVV